MRVFRDLDLVEQLGSGVPRILEYYDKSCFKFMQNHTIMSFPMSIIPREADQVTDQVKSLVLILEKPMSSSELMKKLSLTHKQNFRSNYINTALELGLIELTIPDKPKSSKQKYRLTSKGKALVKII